MKPYSRAELGQSALSLAELPWIPDDLAGSLSAIVRFLVGSFRSEISRIGLYGSWQRGTAGPGSDVDVVVFLTNDVSWFDSNRGIVNRLDARIAMRRWRSVEKRANACRLDSRVYSITIATRGMIEYFQSKGPIHLQNWVRALVNCHRLWESS